MSNVINLNSMIVGSFSMADGGRLPKKHTADGMNVSPQIGWQRVPRETKSLAIICNDADSSSGSWIHWGIFNIPAFLIELEENRPKERVLDNQMKQVVNDFGKVGYFGPIGAKGKHRYVFTVCALDIMIDLNFNPTGQDLIQAMHGHVLEKAILRTHYGQMDMSLKIQRTD